MESTNVRQMRMEPEEISLEAVSDGAALKDINEKLKRLIEDIKDPRKKAAVPRELKISIKVIATPDRSIDEILIAAVEKLAPFSPQKPERWCDGL
jgi:hypothetical protein